VSPEERSFRTHLAAGPFQAGVARGDWECRRIDWPTAVIRVRAASRAGAPDWLALLFDLTGYPRELPTAQPWDEAADTPLARDLWPRGPRAEMAFNPNWNPTALYIPCDRVPMRDHTGWVQQYPAYLWEPKRGIVKYLEVVREILNSPGYSGVVQRAA
jgi:hypothetical protein